MLNFVVEGIPVAKARARVVMRGKYPGAYTPKASKDYETLFAIAAKSAMNKENLKIIETPCDLFVRFYLPIPVSTSKKKTELMRTGEIRHAKKPDLDNLLKQICDAMNGIVWKDDSQVVRIVASKHYGEPCVYVTVIQSALQSAC